MRAKRGCSVTGCNEPHSARGMCHKHYNQWHAATHRRKSKQPKRTPDPGWRAQTGAGPVTEADDEAYRAMARDLGLSAERMRQIRGL